MNLCGLIRPCQNHILFQTKTAPKTIPFSAAHTQSNSLYIGVTPPLPPPPPFRDIKARFYLSTYLPILLINIKHLIYSLINEQIHLTIVSCVYLVFITIDTYLFIILHFFSHRVYQNVTFSINKFCYLIL